MPMDENCEILRQLSDNEVNELLELYKAKYGVQNFHYLLLYNQCKWNQKLKDIGVYDENNNDDAENKNWISFRKKFYTHKNCDFRKYGTYISLHFDIIQSVSFNSWQPEFLELYECLEHTNLIDWRSGPLLTNVYLEFCEKVKEIAKNKGVGIQRARLCHGLIMTHDKALGLEIPALPTEYKMQPLELENAKQVHDIWPNKKEGSLEYIRGLIQISKTLGIYNKLNGELVAWIFQNDFSGLGILQVLDVVQRKGFGSILAKALCKHIAETELVELSAYIVVENFKSEALLEKVGFKKSIFNEWIQLQRCD